MKQFLDILFAIMFICVLSLPLLIFCTLQFIIMGGPIFFRQERIGLNGKKFSILKFRSMNNGEGSDAERLTSWGKFLRSTSMDELPELWHVLCGEMSLVGPRPLPSAYLNRYSPEQARRHDVRPGITGWAQINGRNNLSWEQQFKLDIWYVDNHNWLLDFKILLLTPLSVLKRKDISEQGHVTRSEFLGSKEQELLSCDE